MLSKQVGLHFVLLRENCSDFCSLKMPFCAKQIGFAVIFKGEFTIMHNELATLALQTKNYYLSVTYLIRNTINTACSLVSFIGKLLKEKTEWQTPGLWWIFFKRAFSFQLDDREICKTAHSLLEHGAKFGLLWKKETKWQPAKEDESNDVACKYICATYPCVPMPLS